MNTKIYYFTIRVDYKLENLLILILEIVYGGKRQWYRFKISTYRHNFLLTFLSYMIEQKMKIC